MLSTLLLCLAIGARASERPQPLVFPKSPPPAKTILRVDLMKADEHTRLALTMLQGLVNRKQPRIYIIQDPSWHTAELIPKWIDNLKANGYKFDEVHDPLGLFSTFRSCVKGAALYESDLADKPETLHKLNALTLYCALNNAVPVTEELNARLRLPILFDARGKLNTASEAYGWAYRELWPRANHRVIALTCPSQIGLRDYLVANKIMPFWISQEMGKADEDLCWRFLDEAEPNSPVMGCWGGYGEKPAGRIGEPELQQRTSKRGKFIVVTDGCSNLSVHSGLDYRQPAKRSPARELALNPRKVYVCLNITDGDNLQYVQQYFRTKQWRDDPNRGKIPLSWSMGPSAVDLIPDVLEYFQRTATPNDEFVCSTAGIGLTVPSLYGKGLSDNGKAAYDGYLRLTGQAMRAAGLTSIHLGDTSGVPLNRADLDLWAAKLPGLKGIIADYGPAPGVTPENAALTLASGVPVVRALTAPGNAAPNEKSAQVFADAVRSVTPSQRPAFMHVCLINWFNSPTVAVEAMTKLGPDYVPVLPSELFELMKAAKVPGR